MGAAPEAILIAVGLDRWQRLRPLMEGARACCDACGGTIVGGDIDHHAELTVVTTGLGIVAWDRVVRRKGSIAGDLVCVTGTLGSAQAALIGHDEFRRHLLEPQPRVREGQLLGAAGASSMMDISDGLALSLYDMMEANPGIGYAIDTACLPRPPGIPEPLATHLALYGGGDFELLFTIAPEKFPVSGVEATAIGKVVGKPQALADGRPLEKRGYQHYWGDPGTAT
jgi:thiamine-monophosphate kinase